MNKIIKKIFVTLLLTTIVSTSLFSQSTSFSIIEGNKDSIKIFNSTGKKINIVSEDDIVINSKVVLQTLKNPVTLSYNYGTIELKPNSILIVDPFAKTPLLYLVDGQVTLDTDSPFTQPYSIMTPVSKYEFSSPAKVYVVSTNDLEYGIFYEGEGTSYNALTSQTTKISSAQIIDMAFPNNFTLDIPEEYLTANLDIENSDTSKLISSAYVQKDITLKSENKLLSVENRNNFLNATYLLNIKPIQKSNNFDKYTTINFIITGNGQGNIEAIDFANFSGILKAARNNNSNILLIDGGNTLNGSPYVDFDKGKTAVQVLDKVGYDIFVPGAIDFGFGIQNLSRLNSSSNVNFISTNAMNKDQLFYLNPYGLYLFDDFKVAVLGLSNPSDITHLMDLDLTNQLLIDNAQTAINKAHEVADYVILVSNLNYEGYNSSYILNNVSGLNLLIDSNNSDATLMSIAGVPLITTGVGYSEIQNYSIKVKKSEIISTSYSKVYSSNLMEMDNRLLASLGLTSYSKDSDLINFISNVNIPSNLSFFLTAPIISNVSTSINNMKITSTTKAQPNTPMAPTFVNATLRIPEVPTIVNTVTNSIAPPKFKPSSYIIKVESVMEETISNKVVENTNVENKISPKKAEIFTGEQLNIKTHVGLDTTISGTLDIKDASFTDYDYYGQATIVPYIYHGGYSFGLRLKGDLDSSFAFTSNLYPLPTTTADISEYVVSLVDHLKIVNDSNSIDIKSDRNNFQSMVNSALAYTTLGGTDLHLSANLNAPTFAFNSFISNVDLYKPLTNSTIENVAFEAVFKPADLININVGAIAIGNKSILDIYPSINFNLLPVNNKDIQVKLNIGATTYISAIPTLNFQTFINPSNPNLIANYLANTALEINSETLKISVGGNYLVTEDSTKFTTNMIHKETIRSDIFTPVDTNTLSAIAKVGYTNDSFNLSTIYTLPIDLSTFAIGKDLIDFNLSFNISNLYLGGYYLHNDFINHLKAISNIKAFLVNSNTEYGGYISYVLNNLTMKGALSLPSSTTIPMALTLSLKYKLDLAF